MNERQKDIGIKALAGVAVVAALLLGEWLLVQWVGIIDALIFTVLFVVGATFFPFWIALLGNEMPMNGVLGRVHILLGAIAYDHHYLVDRGDKWEWCPGDETKVLIDDEWHTIDGGFENRSVLGWRPFGILQAKDADTYRNIRVDTAAERDRHGVSADGGAVAIERGGYTEADPPIESGRDSWLVDLKRLYATGVRKIGDIELVETAEAVIERGEVTPSTFEGWRGGMLAIVGLLLGVVVGYLTFLA